MMRIITLTSNFACERLMGMARAAAGASGPTQGEFSESHREGEHLTRRRGGRRGELLYGFLGVVLRASASLRHWFPLTLPDDQIRGTVCQSLDRCRSLLG